MTPPIIRSGISGIHRRSHAKEAFVKFRELAGMTPRHEGYLGDAPRISPKEVAASLDSHLTDELVGRQLAQEYEGKVVIGKYNVDEEGDLATEYRVMSLPTILFFKNGEKAPIRLAGSQTRETLVAKIEELLAL